MKHIVNGNLWKRLFAKIIDFLMVFGLSFLLFFTLIYPNTFDETKYTSNLDKIGEEYDRSQLFLKSSKGNYTSKGAFRAIVKIDDLISIDLSLDGEEFKNVNLTESLVYFYCDVYNTFGNEKNLSVDVFKNQVFKVGTSESNIKDFKIENGNYTYVLEDTSKDAEYKTVLFVLDCYLEAANSVTYSPEVSRLNEENNALMLNTLSLLIPVIVGFSLIFDLIIPLCNEGGQSIGKMIFKLEIITKDGYVLNKWRLIVRWISYLILDLLLGFVTFFGAFLISYTMMVFNKRGMVIHDYISGTRVVDKETTIRFRNAEEERKFNERVGVIQ